jgi:hypothetical protein
MQDQFLQYIAHLRQNIKCGEELILRAKVLADNANPADKREWERELEKREWQVKYFEEMLQVAEEGMQQL